MSSKVAVIGAGFGGLALAIRLQSAGVATTLIEARDKPGGRAYVWKQEGFTFDAGPTVITDPASIDELFALSGRRRATYVDLIPISPFYRLLWPDGTRFDYVNDQAGLDCQIAARNPTDVAGYRRFLKFSEAVYDEGYKRLGHVPFLKITDMLAAAPQLMKLQAWRSVYSKVSGYVADDHLRQALSFHTLLVGGSPFAASSIYALIHALERDGGVWFARGGTNALVAGMARLFTDLGGRLVVGDPVKQIGVEGGRVTGIRHADAAFEAFDAVASNADIVHTYGQLLADAPRGRAVARSLKRRRFSPSLFVVHFGLKRAHPELAHHTILFGPRYRGLIDEIYGKNGLAEDFSLYVHAPSVSDPSVAPPGARPTTPSRRCRTSGREHRLGRRRPALCRPHPGEPGSAADPGASRRPRHPPHLHPEGLRARAERLAGLGLLAGTDPYPERLVPDPQPRRRDP